MSQIFNILENKTTSALISASIAGFAIAKTISVVTLSMTNALPTLLSSDDTKKIFENYKLSEKFALSSKLANTTTTQNWKLRAILKSDIKSFVIFEDSGKTVFLGINESYSGYKLDEISNDKAKFSNGGATFELKIDKKDGTAIKQADSASKTYSISRSEYMKYSKDLGALADEIRANQTNDGIIVSYISKDGFFSKLGIKEGDTIVEANGDRINSFSDIMGIFKNPEQTKSINLIVKRQNLKKELNYEIN
jgi:type II secretion system protein C